MIKKAKVLKDAQVVQVEVEGAPVACDIKGRFYCEGSDYIALLPKDKEDAVSIYGYKSMGDEEGEYEVELVEVEDENLLMKLTEEYQLQK